MAAEPNVLPLERPAKGHAEGAILALTLLSLGHFCVDMYSSALGALQPLLVQKFQISLAQAGILGGILSFSSSVMQPVYGYLSDRFHTRMFTALAPAVAGIFIAALGVAPGYGWLLVMVALGGAGIASFHPQATANAAIGISGSRQQAMAIFISSGTLGLAIGPAYFSFIVKHWGLEQTIWGAALGVIATLLLLGYLKFDPSESQVASARPKKVFDWDAFRPHWKPILVLYLLVCIRSVIQVTYNQFLALYLRLERGYSIAEAGMVLSLFLGAGAIGGFLGGNLADRFGSRKIIWVSMIGSVPFLLLFIFTRGWVSLFGLVVGGAILLFTIPVNVVLAQELVPSQAGTVSALLMGFAWGLAGIIFIPLTGKLADLFTLHKVLMWWIAFPVLGALLTMKLPKSMDHPLHAPPTRRSREAR